GAAGPASSSGEPSSEPSINARATPQPNARSSSCPRARSTTRPRSRPSADARSRSADLPTPGGPSTTMSPPRPPAARSHNSAKAPSSPSRSSSVTVAATRPSIPHAISGDADSAGVALDLGVAVEIRRLDGDALRRAGQRAGERRAERRRLDANEDVASVAHGAVDVGAAADELGLP